MRKELYNKLRTRLHALCVNAAGEYEIAPAEMDDEPCNRAIKHIDLWNHNVEFIEQESAWDRPAVFIEFEPIQWITIVPGIEYRAEGRVRLHIVTDWSTAVEDGTDGAGKFFELPDKIHDVLAGLEGKCFRDFTLAESLTNHNHEDIVESIEVYSFVAIRRGE